MDMYQDKTFGSAGGGSDQFDVQNLAPTASTLLPCSATDDEVCATNYLTTLVNAAVASLSSEFGLEAEAVKNSATLSSAVGQHDALKLFCPARKKHYLKNFTSAYCLMVLMEQSDAGEDLRCQLADARGPQGKRALDRARIALESVFDYGGTNEEEQRQGGVQRARDVGALKHLRAKNVLPNEVISLAQLPGEGLDRWHRNWIAIKRTKENGVTRNATQPVAGLYEWRLVERNGSDATQDKIVHSVRLPKGLAPSEIARIRDLMSAVRAQMTVEVDEVPTDLLSGVVENLNTEVDQPLSFELEGGYE